MDFSSRQEWQWHWPDIAYNAKRLSHCICDIDGKVLKSNIDYNDVVEKVSFGISREPDDFVKEAVKAGHRRFLDYRSIDEVENLISENLLKEPGDILTKRSEWLRWRLNRAKELQEEEDKLHATLAPHCATVLKGKRLLLFGEMLKATGYPDEHLVSDICRGFRVMGWMRDSGCFTKLPKQPSLSISAMLGMAKGLNEAALAKASGNIMMDWFKQRGMRRNWSLRGGGYGKTIRVTSKGFHLPIVSGCNKRRRWESLTSRLKTSGVNATCGMTQKKSCLVWTSLLQPLLGLLHWVQTNVWASKGRRLTWLLKQFPLNVEDRSLLRIAVPVPGDKACRVYGLNSLPFGATGSVAGFLRVSTALFHIMTFGLQIWTGTFVDDFPVISRSDIATSTEQHVALLLDMLGMRFSKEGKKWVPFSNQMSVLGVILDTSNFSNGSVFFKHTDSRKAELNETLDRHLNEGAMTPKEAESLRGRLIWFESFLFGRVANLSLHVIGKRAVSNSTNTTIDGELRRALEFFRDRVVNGPPIEISAATGEVLFVFSDGAFEESSEYPGTVGGALCSESGVPLAFFSEIVPQKLIDRVSWKFSKSYLFSGALGCSCMHFTLGEAFPA